MKIGHTEVEQSKVDALKALEKRMERLIKLFGFITQPPSFPY